MSDLTPLQAHRNRGVVKRKMEDYKKPQNIFDAAEEGNLELVQELLEGEPGLIYKTHDSGFASALHYAAKAGHVKVAKYLIEQKADINRKTQSSRTALHLACERGQINMVKLLLYMGADYTLTNFSKYGTVTTRETPRDVAQDYKFYDIVELLDKYDAHVKKKAAEKVVQEAAEKVEKEAAEKAAKEAAEKDAKEAAKKAAQKEEDNPGEINFELDETIENTETKT